jgi:hypothetical protein
MPKRRQGTGPHANSTALEFALFAKYQKRLEDMTQDELIAVVRMAGRILDDHRTGYYMKLKRIAEAAAVVSAEDFPFKL